MDNIPETLIKMSTMILGVVILIVDFSSKIIFTRELVILRKSDELLLHNEFLSLCILREMGVTKEPGCSLIEVELMHLEVQARYNYLEEL